MNSLLDLVAELAYYALPIGGLFSIFLVGYWLAWTDFKPTKVKKDEYFHINPKHTQDFFEPVKTTRALTGRELGIHDIDDTGALPAEAQRRLRMEEIIRDFSSLSPEETANIIKGWLNER